jgi:hypothetical protein
MVLSFDSNVVRCGCDSRWTVHVQYCHNFSSTMWLVYRHEMHRGCVHVQYRCMKPTKRLPVHVPDVLGSNLKGNAVQRQVLDNRTRPEETDGPVRIHIDKPCYPGA